MLFFQFENSLIERLNSHLTKTPYSHKLGVLYVVDSIVRGYQDSSIANNEQKVGEDAPEGTFAAGVYKISQLIMPIFYNIFGVAPTDDIKVSLPWFLYCKTCFFFFFWSV